MSSITAAQQKAYVQLNHLDKVVQACAIIATVSTIAIIILTGLSVAGYVEPLLPVYILPVPLSSFFIAQLLEECQRAVCKKSQINYEEWNHKKHKPPEDESKKKKTKRK